MALIRKKFLNDAVIYGMAQILVRLRGLIVLPIFVRILGAEGYGIFTQLIITITLLAPSVSFQLERATVRFLAAENDVGRFRRYFYSGLVWSVGAGVIAGLLLALLAKTGALLIFGNVVYSQFLILGGLLLVASIFSNYLQNYFRIIQHVTTFSIIFFIQSLLEIVLMVLMVSFNYGLGGAVWSLIATRLIFGFGLLFIIGQELGLFEVNWLDLRNMLIYSLPLMPDNILLWAINYADRIIIIQFLSVAAVGVYSASYSLSSFLSLFIAPIGFVLFPLLSSLWDKGQIQEVRRYFVYVTRYYLFLVLPGCIGLAFISQPLLRLLATTDFETSTLLIFWIAFGIAMNGIFQINVYVFYLTHKTKYVTIILLLTVLLNVGSNIFLVPVMGLTGAALATAISFLSMAGVAVLYGRRWIGYQIKWLDIGKSAVASVVMAICLYWLPIHSFIGIFGAVLLGGVTYLTTLIFLRTFSKTETFQVRRLIFSYFSLYGF